MSTFNVLITKMKEHNTWCKKFRRPMAIGKYLKCPREFVRVRPVVSTARSFSGSGEKLGANQWYRRAGGLSWLERQLKDPYVKRRDADNYRARSAYKLIEIDQQYNFFQSGMTIVDLGAAPGSWTQVSVERVGASGAVISLEKEAMEPVEGALATISNWDLLAHDAETNCARLKGELGRLGGGEEGPPIVDGLISDMSPSCSGHSSVDHERIATLATAALQLSRRLQTTENLGDDDQSRLRRMFFLCKLWNGERLAELRRVVEQMFIRSAVVKPNASRRRSAEIYLLGLGRRHEFDCSA